MVLILLSFLSLLWWLGAGVPTPCGPRCRRRCICGKGKGTAGKVAVAPGFLLRRDSGNGGATSEDIAKQRESDTNLLNQFLSQLVPGSKEYADLQSQGQGWLSQIGSGPDFTGMIRDLGTKLVQQQQQRIASGEPATPLEARTQASFDQLRKVSELQPFEQDIFSLLQGTAPTTASGQAFQKSTQVTPENQSILDALRGVPGTSPTSQIFQDLVARAQHPDDRFQSTLAPGLELARQNVESQFARRGITPTSGLALEGLGRAGVDLAIQDAQAREASRQEALSNFSQLFQEGQGIQDRQTGAMENLFNVGEQLRSRQIGVEQAQTDLQAGRESNLTNLLASQTARSGQNLLDLLQRTTGTENMKALMAAQQAAAQRAQIGQAIGTGVGAAAGAFFPPLAPVTASAGGQIGASLAGGGKLSTAPNDLTSLLGQQQAMTVHPSSGLSNIDLTNQDSNLDDLLRRVAMGQR